MELDADNYLHIDRNLLYDAATAEDAQDNFSILNQFKDTLNSKAAEASIDPMNYVNKIIVAYKNRDIILRHHISLQSTPE